MPKFQKGSKESKEFMEKIRSQRKKKQKEDVEKISKGSEEKETKVEMPPPVDKRDELKEKMDSMKTLANAIIEIQKDIDFILKELNKVKPAK